MIDRRTLLRTSALVAASLPLAGFTARLPDHPEVMTAHGPVRGYRNGNVAVFKGVRYGADTATTRFARPAAPQGWTDTQDAFDFGAASPQSGTGEVTSEDCLFLNVWTPALGDGGKRPVMLYFHGGAYASGSGSSQLYDGSALVNQGDVVVITLNHRLNAVGFFSLGRLNPDFPDSGNAGMWDLVLALEWVRDNAEAFGGDPSRVFVFGQSGGGAKIATLMAATPARGLFHTAATMSGQQVTACGPLNGELRARAYLDTLGIAPDDTGALRRVPIEQLVEALSSRDPVNPEQGLYFGPVLDGRLLTRHPFWPDAPAQSAALPMILGNTKWETRNLIGGREPDSFDLDWADLPARLVRHMRCDIDPGEVIARYRELYPDYSPSDVFFAATTAGRSWRGQVEEADARARECGPTWVYQFNLGSPVDGGKWGAPHAFDIAFAFNNLDLAAASGSLTPPDTAEARRVAKELSGAFISMARSGNPNHAGLPDWMRHTLPCRQTMVFDTETRLVNDPRKGERELFAKVPFTQWGT